MRWDIVNANCVSWLTEQVRYGFRTDAVVVDPPYHLASIQKRFGGMKADSTGVVADRMRNKSDGGARLARGFMGSQTDAGDVAFQPETWRAVLGAMAPGARMAAFGGTRTWWKLAAAIDAAGFEIEDTIMWVYGQGLVLRRSRLKPCWEPILLCRAPGAVRDLNIEECRIPANERPHVVADYKNTNNSTFSGRVDKSLQGGLKREGETDLGRWPGNLIHDGSPAVLDYLRNTPGQLADARTDGSPKSGLVYGTMRHREGQASANRRYTDRGSTNFAAKPGVCRGDSGSAARFFTCCEFDEEEKRILYCAKAPSGDRMFFCTVCNTRFRGNGPRSEHLHGKPDWSHITGHPTVKPLNLLRHIVRLICPSGGLVLDPFAGSCTLSEAAFLEGRDSVCIELDASHTTGGEARMKGLTQVAPLR